MTGSAFCKTKIISKLIDNFLKNVNSKSTSRLKSDLYNIISYTYDTGRSEVNEVVIASEYEKSKELTDIVPENYIYSEECAEVVRYLINSIKLNSTNNRLNINFDKEFSKDALNAIKAVYALAIANSFEIVKDEYKRKSFIANRERILNGTLSE